MNLNVIDTMMDRLEIRKKMITGSRNTQEWINVYENLNANYRDALYGFYNMLSEEDQISVFLLMSENTSKYAMNMLEWITFMPEWQRTACRIVA